MVIDGSFELLRPIGEGGMGEVWLARDRALGRDVALKAMRPSDSASRSRRFEREARALAALDHPSILFVLHAGEDPATGLHYLVTPAVLLSPSEIGRLCDEVLLCPYPHGFAPPETGAGASPPGEPPGRSEGGAPRPLPLASLLDGGKALPQAAVLRIARDLVGALAAAHAVGILHRDVKPSNVLFAASGRALLADFGLAKFVAGGGSGEAKPPPVAEPTISLDDSGSRKFLGSPAYAAPEQFRDGATLTPAIDWYSLGAVLYEALTGDRPRSLRPPSSYDPASISRAWDSLLRDLLEPDPARRLADPAAIARRLDAIGRTIDPAKRHRRRAARAAFAAVAVLAATTAAAVLFHARNRDKTAATTLNANGNANRCTITFDWQGGKNGISSSSGTYGAPIRWSISRLPSRTGHSFDGFYTQPNGAGEKYFSADGSPVPGHGYTCDMTLYANWTANTYAGSSVPSP